MEAISKGDLNRYVMINSQDEFAVLGRYINFMIEMLKETNRKLEETRQEIIQRLGRAAEYRDNETGMHVVRMSHFSVALAKKGNLSKDQCDLIL
jgi:response regulator RpfG family c-di-GMP phosphodiesterase